MYISVIIPTRNRCGLLAETLESIALQQFDVNDFEVIVIDNGSDDDTSEVCRQYQNSLKNLRYIYDEMPGQLTGRHRGLQEAKGEVLAYIDDDIIVGKNWLQSIRKLADDNPDTAIFGGPSVPLYHAEKPEWVNHFFEDTPYGGKMCLPLSLISLEKDFTIIDPLYVFGLNFIIRKSHLISLKGFHPDVIPSRLQHFQGDGETGLAIKAGMQKLKAIHSSLLTIQHQIPPERLTREFFYKWSFYNGVCSSFTELRYRFDLYTRPSEATPIFKRVKTIFTRVLAKFSRINREKPTDEVSVMFDRVTNQYNAGYQFHQQAFSTDPLVKEWVLRKDYLDYTLPTIHTKAN